MKTLLACLMSVVLVWTPAGLTFGTIPDNAERAACRCCDCGGSGCCVSPSAPESPPLPAIPAPAGNSSPLWLLPVPAPCWTLSESTSLRVASPNSLSLTTFSVPLFTRYCALLI
ncbi:MAG: hypothetical protein KIS67_06440 [Verrucomicrobiae bacterium]|nr:hypothetical protein [Verrucomicrobiae bacterium]